MIAVFCGDGLKGGGTDRALGANANNATSGARQDKLGRTFILMNILKYINCTGYANTVDGF
jgi:hypothetical protein|tara:strand:+ start:1054 stop:1236 length:183 start_codon:yes stop_codon:yes gene_type:complete